MPESKKTPTKKTLDIIEVKDQGLKSFDELEVEQQKKLASLKKRNTEKRSRDDLDILTKEKIKDFSPSNEVKITESFLKSLEEDEKKLEDPKPKSRIRRFFSYVGNKIVSFAKASIDNPVVNTITKAGNWASNTRLGKVVLGSALGRTISVISAVAVIAGIFTPAAPISIAMAGVSIVAVGVAAIIDTLKTRNLRHLERENTLLVTNRNTKSKQDYLLNLNPELATILKNELYHPPLKEDTLKDRYYIAPKLALAITAGRALASNISGIASVINDLAVITGNVAVAAATINPVSIVGVIKDGGSLGLSFINTGITEKQFKNLDLAFKIHINEECIKADTPKYKKIKELETACDEQKIQSATLVKLISEPDYWKINKDPEQLIERFNKIKQDLQSEQKISLQKNSNFFVKSANAVKSYFKDIGRAHNPFYTQPSEVGKHSSLTDSVMKDNLRKQIENEVAAPLRSQLKSNASLPPSNIKQKDPIGAPKKASPSLQK